VRRKRVRVASECNTEFGYFISEERAETISKRVYTIFRNATQASGGCPALCRGENLRNKHNT